MSDSANYEATGQLHHQARRQRRSLSLNGTFERDDSLRYQGLDSVVLTEVAVRSLTRTFNEEDPLDGGCAHRHVLARCDASTPGSATRDHRHRRRQPRQVAQPVGKVGRRRDAGEGLPDAVTAGTLAVDGPIPDLPDAGLDRRREPQHQRQRARHRDGPSAAAARGAKSRSTLDAGYNYTGLQQRGHPRNAGVTTSLKPRRPRRRQRRYPDQPAGARTLGGAWAIISLNFQGGVDHLSDFGTLTDRHARPATGALLSGSTSARATSRATRRRRSASSAIPRSPRFKVPVYDFSRGETVLATRRSATAIRLQSRGRARSDWRVSQLGAAVSSKT